MNYSPGTKANRLFVHVGINEWKAGRAEKMIGVQINSKLLAYAGSEIHSFELGVPLGHAYLKVYLAPKVKNSFWRLL